MQFARLVKRLILEENKQVIMVLSGFMNHMYDEKVLCAKLVRIVDKNE